MALIAYARVSSTGQSLEIQLDKLTKFGCTGGDNKIFSEKKSGTTDVRKELKSCLSHLREGDTLVITKLDRLARSTLHLTQIADDLNKRGIALKVLDQNIDTSTPTGKLLFNMLASIAEFETEIRKERQLDGIAKAKKNGVQLGRKPALTTKQLRELIQDRKDGLLIRELMKKYNLSKASIYRFLDLGKKKEELE